MRACVRACTLRNAPSLTVRGCGNRSRRLQTPLGRVRACTARVYAYRARGAICGAISRGKGARDFFLAVRRCDPQIRDVMMNSESADRERAG